MPGEVTKNNGYRTTWGGSVTAKDTTFQKAQAQLSLLRGKEHGWTPTGKAARRYRKKRKKAGQQARRSLNS